MEKGFMTARRDGRHYGPRRDSRAAIVALLEESPTQLTTPQIMARVGLSTMPTLRHLAKLEEAGQVGKVAGKPYRWYRCAGAAEGAAD